MNRRRNPVNFVHRIVRVGEASKRLDSNVEICPKISLLSFVEQWIGKILEELRLYFREVLKTGKQSRFDSMETRCNWMRKC